MEPLASDDKKVAYVWSTIHKYTGCPDLVGTIGGSLSLTSRLVTVHIVQCFHSVVTVLASVDLERHQVRSALLLPPCLRRTDWIQSRCSIDNCEYA